MKTHSNLDKTLLENSNDPQTKINFICVIEEDLDFENLQSTTEESDLTVNKSDPQLEKVKRYNYLCYLRSMDDMV